jgi:hypothetical protein
MASVSDGVAPAPPPDAARPAPEPPEYAITTLEPDGAGTMIEIDRGAEDGITLDWTGRVIDDVGAPVRGGELTLISVFDRRTRARVALPVETVRGYRAVAMEPPP